MKAPLRGPGSIQAFVNGTGGKRHAPLWHAIEQAFSGSSQSIDRAGAQKNRMTHPYGNGISTAPVAIAASSRLADRFQAASGAGSRSRWTTSAALSAQRSSTPGEDTSSYVERAQPRAHGRSYAPKQIDAATRGHRRPSTRRRRCRT
jgi:hypothetical protein